MVSTSTSQFTVILVALDVPSKVNFLWPSAVLSIMTIEPQTNDDNVGLLTLLTVSLLLRLLSRSSCHTISKLTAMTQEYQTILSSFTPNLTTVTLLRLL